MSNSPSAPAHIDPAVIDTVEVVIEAYIGSATLTVGALSRLSKGEVIELDSQLGRDVELKLNGVVIAQGELVAVDENFAVRISEIAPQ